MLLQGVATTARFVRLATHFMPNKEQTDGDLPFCHAAGLLALRV
jgi:hypothetical protein